MHTMEGTNSTPIRDKRISVKDIVLIMPTERKLPVARQYQVEFSIGGRSLLTKKAKEKKKLVRWDENLFFDGNKNSVLLVKVYQKHQFGRDDLVGGFTEIVGNILDKLRDGVFEEPLPDPKDFSNVSGLSRITIKFALTTDVLGDSIAEERQAVDAVTKMSEAVSALGPAPPPVTLFNSAVEASTNIVTEAQGFNTTWGVLLQRIELFDKIVSGVAQIHPYASLAWSVISAANQVLLKQQSRDDQVIRLAGIMSDVFDFVNDAEPLKAIEAHVKAVTLLIQQVTECGYFIAEYAKQKNFWIRMAKYTISAIDERIASYEARLRELKTAFLEGIAVQTEVTVVRMMNVVDHTAESIDLNDMPYAKGARYAQEKGCLPGTRESFLRDICDILNNPDDDAPRICLLTGVAGSGKSAVAHSIARLYDGQKRLGSSFCFSRSDVATRNPQNLFSTISRDLCDHDPQYKSALWKVVKENRALRTSTSPFEQLERLIIEPYEHLHAVGPLIVVIDALDESGDQTSREQLVRAISKQVADNTLPTHLRFLITTRPEGDVISAFTSTSHLVHKQMGDISDEDVYGDIYKFIHHSLHQYAELESSWPNEQWCQLLASNSQNLFQWAATACGFIQGHGAIGLNPSKRLKILVQNENSASIRPLDELYRTILSQLFTLNEARQSFQEVMAIVLALMVPLSLTDLSALLGSDEDWNIRDILAPMGSLLDGVLDEEKTIRPLHSSFRDFLLDEARSSTFHVHIQPSHSLSLGQASLVCMRKMLRFNICDLKDSREPNMAIPDLPDRIVQAIPHHLAYSCQYWMVHLQDGDPDPGPDLLNEVTLFFKKFFPYWLEAISLLSGFDPLWYIPSAIETCTILNTWAKDHEIAILALEASQFIQIFSPVIRESTPHLYLSAMSQTPTSSPLCAIWLDHLQNHVSVTSEPPVNWPAQIHIIFAHTYVVSCAAYSPDGLYIVSSSWDGTIKVWNATTGQYVAGPFQEDKLDNPIGCVAYSPDGVYVVSGSADGSIRVWNTISSEAVAGPFEGHADAVNSVAYSPKGMHVVSGSDDNTLRVWDSNNGQLVAGPFEGHTGPVCSVAYSPNGTHIVSGSEDTTIRIWDASSGQRVVDPFQGHTEAVKSVAYSPDGTHVVSGSMDATIRVWNSETGQLVGEPFKGHTAGVLSTSYSSDGAHIVSGSIDHTIRMWDAHSGLLVAGPFEEHIDLVTSVAFSPNGTHIVSGSQDNTIRIWNTRGEASTSQFQGHRDSVWSVTYSPDGTQIVSASKDTTIRVWDAISGHPKVDPFQEHTLPINSLSHSSDGIHIVSGSEDKTARIWNRMTGQPVGDPFLGHTDAINSVAYSPDGTHVASGSNDNTVRVWNASNGQSVAGPFEGHTDFVYDVAYSPNGIHIASGSQDSTIRIWNASNGQSVAGPFQGHTEAVGCVAYSPDGTYIASGSLDSTIRIWNVAGDQSISEPLQGHGKAVTSVAFSSDGTSLVSASRDLSIRLWNGVTGEPMAGPFVGHADWVEYVAYSPDGAYIVSGSYDKSIKVWRVEDLVSFGDLCVVDGWIQSADGTAFYGWIAPWNRNDFHLPTHSLIISPHKIYQPQVDRSLFGESWVLCWKN